MRRLTDVLGWLLACAMLAASPTTTGQSIHVSPDSWSFGEVEIGSSDTMIFTMTNRSPTPLRIYAAQIIEDATGSFEISFSPVPPIVDLDDYSWTYLTGVNDTLFFTANDGSTGQELWKSDADGTVLVKDIASGGKSSSPSNLTAANGMLFFTANDGTTARELWLWKSDGTEEGTVPLKNIKPGNWYWYPSNLTSVDGTLFFGAYEESAGQELWKSDGTPEGTVLVKDIALEGESSSPQNLTAVNGMLFFRGDDGINGEELWKSDGTAEGTVLVRDIHPGAVPLRPRYLTDVNGELFFEARYNTSGPGTWELWKSDGTPAGTVLVKDFPPPAGSSYTPYLTTVGETLFFIAYDESTGKELWKSDGTAEGTVLVKDIEPGPDSPGLTYLTAVGDTLFFGANYTWTPDRQWELWKSDGTEAGTALVKVFSFESSPYAPPLLQNVNGMLFLRGGDAYTGQELWKSDGTPGGTILVKDIAPGADSSSPSYLTAVNETLFFGANYSSAGDWELWKSDGTEAGTQLSKAGFNRTDAVEVEVTYAPVDVGAHDAALQIISDSYPPTDVFNVPLQGTGVSEEGEPTELMTELIAFFDTSVAEGLVVGEGPGNSANGRLKAFGNMLDAADDLIAAGDFAGACEQLQDAYDRADGAHPPPDFIGGEKRDDVAAQILDVMSALECN
jgi:ELWxxDGT repeat protein